MQSRIKKYIIIAITVITVCFLMAGAFFYGKTQNNLLPRITEKERVSAEELLKANASSLCIDKANKTATNRLKDLEKQDTSDVSKAAMETEIREQLRTAILNCSM